MVSIVRSTIAGAGGACLVGLPSLAAPGSAAVGIAVVPCAGAIVVTAVVADAENAAEGAPLVVVMPALASPIGTLEDAASVAALDAGGARLAAIARARSELSSVGEPKLAAIARARSALSSVGEPEPAAITRSTRETVSGNGTVAPNALSSGTICPGVMNPWQLKKAKMVLESSMPSSAKRIRRLAVAMKLGDALCVLETFKPKAKAKAQAFRIV